MCVNKSYEQWNCRKNAQLTKLRSRPKALKWNLPTTLALLLWAFKWLEFPASPEEEKPIRFARETKRDSMRNPKWNNKRGIMEQWSQAKRLKYAQNRWAGHKSRGPSKQMSVGITFALFQHCQVPLFCSQWAISLVSSPSPYGSDTPPGLN